MDNHHTGQAFGLTFGGGPPGAPTPGRKPEGLLRVELRPESHIQPDNPPPAWRPLMSVHLSSYLLIQVLPGLAQIQSPQSPTQQESIPKSKVADPVWCVHSFN